MTVVVVAVLVGWGWLEDSGGVTRRMEMTKMRREMEKTNIWSFVASLLAIEVDENLSCRVEGGRWVVVIQGAAGFHSMQ